MFLKKGDSKKFIYTQICVCVYNISISNKAQCCTFNKIVATIILNVYNSYSLYDTNLNE